MWEIMTLALQPYADVDACEMDTYLRDGYRVSHPPHCPDELLVHLLLKMFTSTVKISFIVVLYVLRD